MPSARRDLVDLHEWIAESSGVERADLVIDEIETRVAFLADFPFAGPPRPQVAPDARGLVGRRWLILYRVLETEVQVVRIVDQARDLSRIKLAPDAEH